MSAISKRAFVVNLVVWAVVLVGCGVLVSMNVGSAVSHTSGGFGVSPLEAWLQTLSVFALPIALYAAGAIGGLVYVRARRTVIPRGARTACRVASALVIGNGLLSCVPILLAGATGAGYIGISASLLLFSLSFSLPVLPVALGVVYAFGLAGARPRPGAGGDGTPPEPGAPAPAPGAPPAPVSGPTSDVPPALGAPPAPDGPLNGEKSPGDGAPVSPGAPSA